MDKSFKSQLGQRIKELRRSRHLTQEKLAEQMNMERSNLARLECGKQFPNVDNLERFIQIFNIMPKDFFDFGHFQDKQALINEIILALNEFNIDKVQYIYKSVINIRNI